MVGAVRRRTAAAVPRGKTAAADGLSAAAVFSPVCVAQAENIRKEDKNMKNKKTLPAVKPLQSLRQRAESIIRGFSESVSKRNLPGNVKMAG